MLWFFYYILGSRKKCSQSEAKANKIMMENTVGECEICGFSEAFYSLSTSRRERFFSGAPKHHILRHFIARNKRNFYSPDIVYFFSSFLHTTEGEQGKKQSRGKKDWENVYLIVYVLQLCWLLYTHNPNVFPLFLFHPTNTTVPRKSFIKIEKVFFPCFFSLFHKLFFSSL